MQQRLTDVGGSRGGAAGRRSSGGWVLVAWLVLGVMGSACSASPDAPMVASVATPLGCERTMCDHLYAVCADPCGSCRSQCRGEFEYVNVLTCSMRCDEICATVAREGNPPVLACQAALSRCRATQRNAVCVDHVADRRAPGESGPVCSEAMAQANCACGNDAACVRALEDLNPTCRKCNNDWKETCLAAACQAEADAYTACLRSDACGGASNCAACDRAEETVTHCLRWSATDPRDIAGGGCHSRARTCWDDPFCPDGVLK
jgi:hypothetical protein